MRPPLTDVVIRKAEPPSAGQVEIWDGKVPGFGIRVSSSGAKSFVLLYRHAGKPRRMTLGRYPMLSLAEAREKATAAIRQLEQGIDPVPTKEEIQRQDEARVVYRFEDVVGSFIKLHCERHNRAVTAKDTARILKNRFVTRWADRDIRDITRMEIVRLLDGIVEAGTPSAANHALSAIRKFFNWCLERGLLETSPCLGVKKPTKDRSRDRVLDAAETRAIWQAADHVGVPFGPIVKLLLLTAQRRSEVGSMQWGHLDLDAREWTLPAELTKSNRAHIVPLTPEACRLIASLPRFSDVYVFGASNPGRPFSDYAIGKQRLDSVAQVPNWTLHDLRRTAATQMARLGTPPHVVERILNHTSGTFGGVAGVYNRFQYVPEMRAALDRWAKAIDRSPAENADASTDPLGAHSMLKPQETG